MSQAVTGLVKRPIKVTIRRQNETLMEQIFQTTPIRIGRMLDNDLALPFDFISRYHCEMRFENETWNAYDLGSKNGFLIEASSGNQVRLERVNTLKLEDGMNFFIQELNVSLEFMDPLDFSQSYSQRTDTIIDEIPVDSHVGPQPMVEVDLQNLMFVPHVSAVSSKHRSLQVTTVWHDQVLDTKEFAVGETIVWEFNGGQQELGRVSKDKAVIRVPKGCTPVEGADVIGGVKEKKSKKPHMIQANLETPTAFNVSDTLFVYFRFIPKSRALPMATRLIDEKMMDPLMFSSAVHGTAALAALALSGKPHAPPVAPVEPERFATVIMPQPTAVPTPEPVQVAAQPTPEPTPEPTPVSEKPKPKKIAKKIEPPKELPKPTKVVKEVVRKRAIAKKEEIAQPKPELPVKPVEKVAKVEPPKEKPSEIKVAALPVEKTPPAPAPAGTPAPPAPTPQPFNAKSVGALKAFALLKPGPASVNLANVEKIQVSRAPSSTTGSVMGATAVQGTGDILTQLNQSATGGGTGSGDGAGGVAVGGKAAGGSYEVAGLAGKAGKRKIKGSVLGGATYTELSKNDGLTREQVMKEVTRHQSEIQRCYEEALMFNPDLSGNAEYEWEISAKGPVNFVKIKSATLKNGEKLLDCVKKVFVKMNFPKAKNGENTNSTITLPFGRL